MRLMRKKEKEAAKMRYEWRKSCESSYDRQIVGNLKKADQEKKEVLTGPTTIGALGSHYDQ